jgi:hypothetical protein
MSPSLVFCLVFLALLISILYFDIKYDMLKDISQAKKKPYSFAKVQLAWWIVIILGSFISIILMEHGVLTLNSSTLVLLGISTGTSATARIIDLSNVSNHDIRNQDDGTSNFILDILSDENGVSLHRFQAAIFNIVFGLWFLGYVWANLSNHLANTIMPVIDNNNLILLGLSSGVYTAMKTTENKTTDLVPKTTSH